MTVKCAFHLVVLCIPVLLTGCASVEPWEKGDLADPIMQFEENPIDAGIKEHYLDYREGSVGGTPAQSGGCGCG